MHQATSDLMNVAQFLLKASVEVHYLNLSNFSRIDHYYSPLHSQYHTQPVVITWTVAISQGYKPSCQEAISQQRKHNPVYKTFCPTHTSTSKSNRTVTYPHFLLTPHSWCIFLWWRQEVRRKQGIVGILGWVFNTSCLVPRVTSEMPHNSHSVS